MGEVSWWEKWRRWRNQWGVATRTSAQEGAGGRGEDAAADYLAGTRNYRLIVRNWRDAPYEIDLVLWDGPVLVFVEVRARNEHALVGGYDSLTRRKREALRRAGLAYLRQCRRRPAHFRFDMVEASLQEGRVGGLLHHENIAIFRKEDRVRPTGAPSGGTRP